MPDLRGTVMDLAPHGFSMEAGLRGRSDRMDVILLKDTRLYTSRMGLPVEDPLAPLQVGVRVEVWITGGLMLSSPPQAFASAVLVVP